MSNPLYASVTASVIAELERGALPWIKPWNASMSADRNLVSDKAYHGINRFILGLTAMSKGYTAPVWATYKQWQAEGASVRAGEKAAHICFYKPVIGTKTDDAGELHSERYSVLKSYCVFNAQQVEGYTLPAVAELPAFEPIAKCDSTIANTGAVIRHGGDLPFYSVNNDAIQMPQQSTFAKPEGYYAIAFHELSHWTGHKSRLDRDQQGKFGAPRYAFEELVAEMSAAFLCADHAIAGAVRHAGYIQSWLTCLRENDQAIFKAAALAQKAADFILQQQATEEKVAA